MTAFLDSLDGPKVIPDEDENRLPSPEFAMRQAKVLAVELSKAGEFCRSNLVLVLDENGNILVVGPSDEGPEGPDTHSHDPRS